VSLYVLDLTTVLGQPERNLVFNHQIALNRRSFLIKSLADTRANRFLFININLIKQLIRKLGLRTVRLSRSCPVNGFDGKPAEPITHAVLLSITIDSRTQQQVPMLVADIGQHDMIIGRMWFEKHRVLLDYKGRRMIWPDEPTLFESVAAKMATPFPIRILKREDLVDPAYQADADQRDLRLERESNFKPPRKQVTPKTEMVFQPKKQVLEIAIIGGTGFYRLLQKPKNEGFITSLSEIERIIEEKRAITKEDRVEAETIVTAIPSEYQEYADVFSKRGSNTLPPHRGKSDHRIELQEQAQPGYCPLYKQSAEELEATKLYITENLHKGFLEPSSAPFTSPLLMVRKPDRGLRFCVDYRKLNALTKKDRYPLPLIDKLLQRVNKAKFFTKLDIRQGFHRIRMHPKSEDLTTFRTRYGSFKYKVMPFGVTNGPATFQRYINTVLDEYLDDFATAYVDDILIYSESYDKHIEHVRLVLERLRTAGLQASLSKCEFHITETRFLGFIVSTKGITVDPTKVEVVVNWRQPTTVKSVQSFLRFYNFYRSFIKDYSRIAKPLHSLTRSDIQFEWTSKRQEAFEELKKRLTNAPILAHYDPTLPTRIETNASDGVLSAVLSQQGPDLRWHPIAYFSKTMAPAKRNYKIHDKELLTIIRALKEWRAELEGLQRDDPFDIFTDHQALEYFMTTKKLNSRQARWSLYLSRFHFRIRYRPRKQNVLADMLSRKERQCIDEGRTLTLLPRSCLEKGVLSFPIAQDQLAELAPIQQEESEDVITRVMTSNRYHESLAENRQTATSEASSR
jgi:hypothetical protein